MSHLSNAWFHRLKAAQRDLIKMCGGIARAAELTSTSTSHVGRWNQAKDTDLMPINAIIILEADCGQPIVTSAMAELNGFRVEDPERAVKTTTSIMSSLSDAVQEAGALFATGAAAAADGKFSPAELTSLERAASTLTAKVGDLRNTLAAAQVDDTLRTVVG
ncbi:hypothetical protein KQ944_17930 [Bacillus subtilis]|uniref:phage regulatory CII family protein n=1 Tax=Pseudochrobactrum asaccharolyticum TaxID=354351 RepID=UPI001F34815F|nr:phage regulatory CII family protein [Pseudochrobactrum asaccharolyticum]MCF7646876.1 hypothetical protein [Pseudochrobactrum asaccharolyticum]MCF7673518.1 hypothetical protein [Bacillus subtilis]